MSTTFADRGEITPLTERVAAGVGRVDREAGVIRGVRILGRVSKNGRTYLPQAITGAKPFYEGIRVNCDHPASARGDRSIADRIGWLAGVRESDGGLRGDLHLILSHPFTPAVLEMAEKNPSMLGLSHNAEGRIVKRDGKNVVEEITHVRSVDLVADPATASSLFESKERIYTMTNAEFAERLFETDGSFAPPRTDPVDNVAAADDKPKPVDFDETRRKAQAILDTASNPGDMFRRFRELEEETVGAANSELAAASESLDPSYSFAAAICEDARGFRSPSGRDPSAAFAAALFD